MRHTCKASSDISLTFTLTSTDPPVRSSSSSPRTSSSSSSSFLPVFGCRRKEGKVKGERKGEERRDYVGENVDMDGGKERERGR